MITWKTSRVLLAIVRVEFAIDGLSNQRPRALLVGKTKGQIGRILQRLRPRRRAQAGRA